MIRRAVVSLALTATSALTAATLVAAPAPAASSYAVSLASSRASADVGTTTRLSGKVTGSGAAGKVLAIDVRVGAGAWRRVTTVTTTSTGSYAKTVRLTQAGPLTYRVVAPRSKTVGTGTRSVAVTGYRWLDLYDESYLSDGGVISRGAFPTTTFGGEKAPKHTFGMGQGAFIAWNFDHLCDQLVAQVGLTDGDTGTSHVIRFEGGATEVDSSVTGGEGFTGYADLDTTDVSYYRVRRPDQGYVYLAAPRAHCAADELPVAVD